VPINITPQLMIRPRCQESSAVVSFIRNGPVNRSLLMLPPSTRDPLRMSSRHSRLPLTFKHIPTSKQPKILGALDSRRTDTLEAEKQGLRELLKSKGR